VAGLMDMSEQILEVLLQFRDATEAHFNVIDGRLDGIDGRLDGIDGRLDRIERKLDRHETRIEALEEWRASRA
jgi:tetrahydromethanopterin S-methyltransferase subunit G